MRPCDAFGSSKGSSPFSARLDEGSPGEGDGFARFALRADDDDEEEEEEEEEEEGDDSGRLGMIFPTLTLFNIVEARPFYQVSHSP